MDRAGGGNGGDVDRAGASILAPPSVSLPQGGGAIHGAGETFTVDAATGAASFAFPLGTGAGRAGAPALELRYDSGAGNGPFGLGFRVGLPSIARRTDKGLPAYEDARDSDTIEAINEATQLYLLAWQILGDRPEEVPPIGEPEVQTYDRLRSSLGGLSDALVEIENYTGTAAVGAGARIADGLPSLGQTLYFGVPPNDELLSYWDTVADRLFKIRHCMNIEGVVRQLPLFEPPIDPALLVAASAAGVDIQSALTDLNAPLPQYRFSVMVQEAKELCGTVKALGSALLSALERRDAGALELLRSGHEIAVLQAMHEAKKQAVDEAKATHAGLEKSRDAAVSRQDYYQGLIDAGYLSEEQAQLEHIGKAGFYQASSQLTRLMGAAAGQTPDATGGSAGTASPVVTLTIGGSSARGIIEIIAGAFDVAASAERSSAESVGIIAGHARRNQEWQQQLDVATKDIETLDMQIAAARIRVAIAGKDLASHEVQMANAKEVETFLRTRFTSQELYDWMAGQISSLYFQSYQLAYDVAKRAEQCYRHELGLPSASFIQFGSWDSLEKGLLAGERLQADLDRMDASYLDNDRREYEIHKDISLALLDPAALVQLRQVGKCSVELPEVLFDIDYPGHYLRRIKSVSFTVPCVAGPFAGVGMTVTLTKSSVRTSDGSGATRLIGEAGAAESIVTSRGEQDGGVFELSHQDPRYLPFERRGAISSWDLALAGALPQFDWQSITDVVMHLRYTAREGGTALKTKVEGELREAINAVVGGSGGKGPALGVNAASDAADAWYQFLHPSDATADTSLVIDLGAARFPYAFQQESIYITEVEVIVLLADPAAYVGRELSLRLSVGGAAPALAQELKRDEQWGHQPVAMFALPAETRPGTLTLTAARADVAALAAASALTNLLIIARYRLT